MQKTQQAEDHKIEYPYKNQIHFKQQNTTQQNITQANQSKLNQTAAQKLKFRRIKKKKGDEIPEGINPDVVIEKPAQINDTIVEPEEMMECNNIIQTQGYDIVNLTDYRYSIRAVLQLNIYTMNIFTEILDVESMYKTIQTADLDLNFTALDHAPACIQLNSTIENKFYAFCFDDRRKVKSWQEAGWKFKYCRKHNEYPRINYTEIDELMELRDEHERMEKKKEDCDEINCPNVSKLDWYVRPPR